MCLCMAAIRPGFARPAAYRPVNPSSYPSACLSPRSAAPSVARLWEVPALVHECVGELALRVCSPPPVQPRATTQPQPPGAAAWGPPLAEVPRLLAAWDNVRRWGLLPREEGGGAGGEAAAGAPSDLDVQWLRWMGRWGGLAVGWGRLGEAWTGM